MAVFKCKMCGGTIDVYDGKKVVTCDFCGTTQTVYSFDSEKKTTYFKRANALRYKCQFDKAAGIYETIVSEFPNEAEAYWGLVLCKYGIEYVDDPKTGSKIPTCHRTQFSSIYDDSDYKNCIKNADIVSKSVYEKEAKEISKLQKSILEISSKEDPFDIFICYKESDSNGNRTPDSVLAQDIYKELTNDGYRVFFSRITLEDKLGSQYEPYIFAALHSSKVMIHVTTSDEYSESVWVRNEWSRYLSLIADGQKKTLIPCYKDISAYELPEEMQHLQGQDMSKLGAMQDLVRGVNKIIGKNKVATNISITSNSLGAEQDAYESQLRKGYVYLSKKMFDDAKETFENAVKLVEKCGRAYIGLMLAEAKEVNIDNYLISVYSAYGTYKTDKLDLARSFADEKCLKELEDIDAKIEKLMYKDAKDYFLNLLVEHRWNEAEEYLNKEKKYHDEFLELYKETKYRYLIDSINEKIDVKNLYVIDDLIEGFNQLTGYKDSNEKIRLCGELKTKILDDWNKECINNLAITYPDEITLKSLDALARQINGNNAFIKSLDSCTDIIKNAYDDIQDDAYKFIEGKSYSLISSFSNLSDCSKLIKILSSLNKNDYFDKVFVAIHEQENYIRDVEKQIKKKKTKKRLKLFGIVCAALAICTGVFFGVKAIVDEKNRSNTYDYALAAMNAGDYDEAIANYKSLGNYKDSENRIEICNGLIKLKLSVVNDSEEYAIAGIKQIVTAGEKVDVIYEVENNPNIKKAFNPSANSGNKTETIDSTTFTIYEPTWGGYTFLKWSPTKVSYKDNRTYLDMLSNWSLNAYSIDYVLDGGTNNASNPKTYSVESGDIFLLPASKEGYTFDGWFDIGSNNRVDKILNGTYGDISLKANWVANEYIITLNPNGVDLDQTTINVKYNAEFTLPTLTRDHYGFDGWYDLNNTKWVDGKYLVPNDVLLTARWRANVYSITYILNNGINNSDNPNSYTTEDSIVLLEPTRVGYTFTGWFDESNSKVTGISLGSGGDKIFSARWNIKSYTVVFKNYDGSILDTQFVDHGSTATYGGSTPSRPANAQYTYSWSGWDKSLTNITCDTILFASYSSTVNKYTITWTNYDGALLKTESIEYGTIPSYSGPTPTKAEDDFYTYSLSGWSPELEKVTSSKTYVAQFVKNAKYIYSVSNNEATIIDIGVKNLDKYDIPTSIDGYSVTKIASNAFQGCSKAEEIYVPDSVLSIGKGAFSGTSSLNKITLPFAGSKNISYKTVLDSSEMLFGHIFGDEQFDNAESLRWSINDDSGYLYVPKSLKTVIIERSNRIGDDAVGGIVSKCFSSCTMIESVMLGSNIDGIGAYAFWDCTSLQTLVMKDVKVISCASFLDCSKLNYISWSNNVENIETLAFGNCSSLETINLPDSLLTIDDAFYGCSSIKELNIPFVGDGKDSLLFGRIFGYNKASSSMFKQITQYTDNDDCINAKNGVMFSIPLSLSKITVRNEVSTSFAFSGLSCASAEVSLPSVKGVEKFAFARSNVKSVTIPAATRIYNYAFYWAGESLTTVNCPNVTEIDSNAFDYSGILYYDSAFLSKTNVEYLGPHSFANICYTSALDYVILPVTLKDIESLSFGTAYYNGYSTSTKFFYEGTEEQWSLVYKSASWCYFSSSVAVYYYSYDYLSGGWHYVDGVPTVW